MKHPLSSLPPLSPVIPAFCSYQLTTKHFVGTTNFGKPLVKSTLFPHGFGTNSLLVWINMRTKTTVWEDLSNYRGYRKKTTELESLNPYSR